MIESLEYSRFFFSKRTSFSLIFFINLNPIFLNCFSFLFISFLFLYIYMLRYLSKRYFSNTRNIMTNSPIEHKPILALPSTAEETVEKVDVNDTYKLKELGPVVVNENGTLSRINNWREMTDIEKSNVNRILLKRNRARLEKLKAKAAAEEQSEEKTS
ncbi:unnamed protein product [Cunninghamella blakesleeana]